MAAKATARVQKREASEASIQRQREYKCESVQAGGSQQGLYARHTSNAFFTREALSISRAARNPCATWTL
jgi:hypothetical protein